MAMLEDAATLPDDPDELRAAAVSLVSLVMSQALTIAKLEHELAGHRRHRFGVRSESLDQLALGLEEQEIAAAKTDRAESGGETDDATDKATEPKHKPMPDTLPRTEQVLSPGEACGRCGGGLKALGEDVTEELEYILGCSPSHSNHWRADGSLW